MKNLQVLKRPIITEKSMNASAEGKYTFEVDTQARKDEIAKAVEKAFGVHVKGLTTITVHGKTRRTGRKRKVVAASPTKKAIVRLTAGEKIDVFSAGGAETKGSTK